MSFNNDAEESYYDENGTILLAAAVISISAVVFLSSLLYAYARCIMRRRAWEIELSINANSNYHHFGEPSNRGLDPSIIASLPKFVFKRPGDAKDVESGETECSVCLSSIEDGEMARNLPNCGHIFHAECVERWISSESTCPICRRVAKPWPGLAVQPEPREGAVGVPLFPMGPTAPPSDSAATMKGTSQGSARING